MNTTSAEQILSVSMTTESRETESQSITKQSSTATGGNPTNRPLHITNEDIISGSATTNTASTLDTSSKAANITLSIVSESFETTTRQSFTAERGKPTSKFRVLLLCYQLMMVECMT